MQLVKINASTTLSDLAELVGEDNVDKVLALNNIQRQRKVGAAFVDLCNQVSSNDMNLSAQDKLSLLNTVTADGDIFEELALGDDGTWKVMASLKTLPNMLRLPDEVLLPDNTQTLGNDSSITHTIYRKVVESIHHSGQVDPSIFNKYDASVTVPNDAARKPTSNNVFQYFHIPWGQVVLYSSLSKESKDLPVYPEELNDSTSAEYTQMPDMLYQYEPWQVYKSSGPRSGTYTFTFHRDMWTGDHTDGLANELIRFCEANCFPEYKGSAVHTGLVTLYIAGKNYITGVLTNVNKHWYGPIGHDGWYLACDLELTITEVSPVPLNYQTVASKGIIG